MSDFDQALQRFRKAYDELFQLIDSYGVERGEAAGATGSWSPKQTLAHFSGWIAEMLNQFEAYRLGEKRFYERDFDTFNANSVTQREGLDWNGTVDELRALYNRAITEAENITLEVSAANVRYQKWLDGIGEDCEEHLVELREFKEKA